MCTFLVSLPTCVIELLTSAPLPSSRLYNSSRPEREAMEEYIQGSLLASLDHPLLP